MVLDRIMPLCGDGHFNHQTCVFMNVQSALSFN